MTNPSSRQLFTSGSKCSSSSTHDKQHDSEEESPTKMCIPDVLRTNKEQKNDRFEIDVDPSSRQCMIRDNFLSSYYDPKADDYKIPLASPSSTPVRVTGYVSSSPCPVSIAPSRPYQYCSPYTVGGTDFAFSFTLHEDKEQSAEFVNVLALLHKEVSYYREAPISTDLSEGDFVDCVGTIEFVSLYLAEEGNASRIEKIIPFFMLKSLSKISKGANNNQKHSSMQDSFPTSYGSMQEQTQMGERWRMAQNEWYSCNWSEF